MLQQKYTKHKIYNTIENKRNNLVNYFKCLGGIITNDGKSTIEIRSRIVHATNMNSSTKNKLIKLYLCNVNF